ncbi:MAG: hypothetical protein R3E08_01585 [Thiotrichaceae bacterium]
MLNFVRWLFLKNFESHPQQVHRELSAETSRLQQKIQQLDARKQELASQHHKFLWNAYQILDRAAAFAELSESSQSRGTLALIEGWLPEHELAHLHTMLQQKLPHPHAALPIARPLIRNSKPYLFLDTTSLDICGISNLGEKLCDLALWRI